MNATVTDRRSFLDALKCIAIFLVCLYHSENVFVQINALSSPSDYKAQIAYFIHAISSIAVPLFFMINGALLFNKPYNHSKHLRKTIKIIILGFLWSFISFIAISALKHESLTLVELMKGTWDLTLGKTEHLWFLKALVLVYLLFPVLKIVFDSPDQSGILFYTMGLFFIFSFGDLALNQVLDVCRFLFNTNLLQGKQFNFFPNINPFGNYFYAAFYFVLGGYLNSDRWKWSNISTKMLLISFTIPWVFLYAYGILKSNLIGYSFDTVYNAYYSIMTLIMVVSVYLLSQKLTYKNDLVREIVRKVGENTLGIYLVHKIIHIALIEYLAKNQSIFTQGWIINNFCYALILLIISLWITEILRKLPFIRASVTV